MKQTNTFGKITIDATKESETITHILKTRNAIWDAREEAEVLLTHLENDYSTVAPEDRGWRKNERREHMKAALQETIDDLREQQDRIEEFLTIIHTGKIK